MSVFADTSLIFLGHVLDKDGCHPNPHRVAAIQSLPLPGTKKGLHFLGSVNVYHMFISEAAVLRFTLYDVIAAVKKRDGSLRWSDITQAAFKYAVEPLSPQQPWLIQSPTHNYALALMLLAPQLVQ